ncbi:hypothetical protein Q604_UNBc4C00291G0001, partial [human gut metagenome]
RSSPLTILLGFLKNKGWWAIIISHLFCTASSITSFVQSKANNTFLILWFNSGEIIEPHDRNENKDCGIGRIIRLNDSISLDEVIKRIKNNLKIDNLRSSPLTI